MSKLLINCICLFIPFSKKRRAFRTYLLSLKNREKKIVYKRYVAAFPQTFEELEVANRNNPSEVFSKIFAKKYWLAEKSLSGPGSELENTKNFRAWLKKFIKDYNIKSIIDVPCGDMNWMKKLNLKNIRYYGYDIVDDLIANNKVKFRKNKNYQFEVKNAIEDPLSTVDLILCRDLIIHFPLDAIWSLLNNFVKSGAKYLVITEIRYGQEKNDDIEFGNCVPRDLTKPPFCFNPGKLFINDHEVEEPSGLNGMTLYEIADIKKELVRANKYVP